MTLNLLIHKAEEILSLLKTMVVEEKGVVANHFLMTFLVFTKVTKER